jgi:hypothetical protein
MQKFLIFDICGVPAKGNGEFSGSLVENNLKLIGFSGSGLVMGNLWV